MLLSVPVIALFLSASVGGSTKSAVFSSAESNGSVPHLVTHGCSLNKSELEASCRYKRLTRSWSIVILFDGSFSSSL